jgi:hypothetical protein
VVSPRGEHSWASSLHVGRRFSAGKWLDEGREAAISSRELKQFVDYARALLQKEVISATEVLASLLD